VGPARLDDGLNRSRIDEALRQTKAPQRSARQHSSGLDVRSAGVAAQACSRRGIAIDINR